MDHGFDKNFGGRPADAAQAIDPRTQAYRKLIARRGVSVEPKLLAEIEYRAKSAEGKVRHPFFKGLREDLYWMRSIGAIRPRSARTIPTLARRTRRRSPSREQTTAPALGFRVLPSARSEFIATALNFGPIGLKANQGIRHGCVGEKQRPRKWAG